MYDQRGIGYLSGYLSINPRSFEITFRTTIETLPKVSASRFKPSVADSVLEDSAGD